MDFDDWIFPSTQEQFFFLILKVIPADDWAYVPCIVGRFLKDNTRIGMNGNDAELSWFFPEDKIIFEDLLEGEFAIERKGNHRMRRL